jgi:hypothetical protein
MQFALSSVGNTFVPPDANEPAWAWLKSGIAQLMLAKASEPVHSKPSFSIST